MNKETTHSVREILAALDSGLKPTIPVPTGPDTWAYINLDVNNLRFTLADLPKNTAIPCEITLCFVWFSVPARY